MKQLFIGLLTFTLFVSLVRVDGAGMKTKNNREKEKKILLEMDRELAKASSEKGILTAFYPFMTEHSVLLPEKGHPLYGKNTCEKLMKHSDIKGREGQPGWEPIFVDVSAAGDLGYTHGRFERPGAGPGGGKKINHGYYATIWQKNSRGNWKVAFSQGLLSLKDLKQKPIAKKIAWAKIDAAAIVGIIKTMQA